MSKSLTSTTNGQDCARCRTLAPFVRMDVEISRGRAGVAGPRWRWKPTRIGRQRRRLDGGTSDGCGRATQIGTVTPVCAQNGEVIARSLRRYRELWLVAVEKGGRNGFAANRGGMIPGIGSRGWGDWRSSNVDVGDQCQRLANARRGDDLKWRGGRSRSGERGAQDRSYYFDGCLLSQRVQIRPAAESMAWRRWREAGRGGGFFGGKLQVVQRRYQRLAR